MDGWMGGWIRSDVVSFLLHVKKAGNFAALLALSFFHITQAVVESRIDGTAALPLHVSFQHRSQHFFVYGNAALNRAQNFF